MTIRTEDSLRKAALKADVTARGGSFLADAHPFTRDVAFWRAFQPGRSVVQVRAAYLEELVNIATLRILPNWTIAGEHLIQGQGFGFNLLDEKYKAQTHRLGELGVDPAKADDIRGAVTNWLSRVDQPCYAVGETDAAMLKGKGPWGNPVVLIAGGWVENHSIRDFAKVLRVGFEGIAAELRVQIDRADIADGNFVQKDNFWRAALSICRAGCELGRRHADLAAALAEEATDLADAQRLRGIADACTVVPAYPARTLYQAVQSLWLAQVLTCAEDGINANSIGRLDQILQPYYQADLQAGRINRGQAVDLMEELACKMHLDYNVQAIVLSGQDRAGRDATCDMTYIILEATRSVGLIRDLSVRLHRDSPPQLVETCADLIAQGGGIPFLFNDDCFVKALADRGIATEDARDYAPIGCIELTIPGKANPRAVSGWLNAAKCMELALFDGEDPRDGEQIGPRTGRLTDFATYDDLVAAFSRQLDHFTRLTVYHCNRGELAQRERGPLPCWSVLTDDCIARGRDITDGGAIYHYHSIAFLGAANVADSLVAVRKLVYEQGRVGKGELLDALRGNFDGCEPLRQLLLNAAPKYGNGVEEVDRVVAWVTGTFIDLLDTFRSPSGARFFAHLFSFLCNIEFGRALGATPDGRRAGEPIAYSLSAQQGRDRKGVTAMLQSLAHMPHDRAGGATAAIIDVDPKVVHGARGAGILAALIRSAIGMGVGQMQFNVVTTERLRLAQQQPQEHGNLAVRVAGYSQKFNQLNAELQELVISRTKHTTG